MRWLDTNWKMGDSKEVFRRGAKDHEGLPVDFSNFYSSYLTSSLFWARRF